MSKVEAKYALMKKSVTFTVTSGTPLKDFREVHFFVTKSRIDPQSREDSNHPSVGDALRAARGHAKQVNGTIIKTTVQEVK